MEKEILLRINLAKVNFTYVEEMIAQYFTDGRKRARKRAFYFQLLHYTLL